MRNFVTTCVACKIDLQNVGMSREDRRLEIGGPEQRSAECPDREWRVKSQTRRSLCDRRRADYLVRVQVRWPERVEQSGRVRRSEGSIYLAAQAATRLVVYSGTPSGTSVRGWDTLKPLLPADVSLVVYGPPIAAIGGRVDVPNTDGPLLKGTGTRSMSDSSRDGSKPPRRCSKVRTSTIVSVAFGRPPESVQRHQSSLVTPSSRK